MKRRNDNHSPGPVIRELVKALRREYFKAKALASRSGEGAVSFKFFKEMDAVLGCRPTSQPKKVIDTFDPPETGAEMDSESDAEPNPTPLPKTVTDTENTVSVSIVHKLSFVLFFSRGGGWSYPRTKTI